MFSMCATSLANAGPAPASCVTFSSQIRFAPMHDMDGCSSLVCSPVQHAGSCLLSLNKEAAI